MDLRAEPRRQLVLPFDQVEVGALEQVGGKGLSLGVVAGAGLPVPPGYCVTTSAYRAFVENVPGFLEARDRVDALRAEDTEAIRGVAADMRALLLGVTLPAALIDAVSSAHAALPEHARERAFAVRSSANLEDLPEASFAGQHDTHLGVRGLDEILARVRECFSSLFTDRAVAYRRRQDLREAEAKMAVVVQSMVASDVAGVLFTADPVSGSRDVCVVDASYGLGESVVSGIVNPDSYRLHKHNGVLAAHTVGDKASSIVQLPNGGTETREVSAADRERRALSDEELADIVELGRQVEAHYGEPQDVEWALEGGTLHLLQSRPITSLYPLPTPRREDVLGAYLCVGHQQANPAVWSPMGISLLGLLFSFGRAERFTPSPLISEAGHRLYFDVTALMHKLPFRKILPRAAMMISPAIATRLQAIVDRPDFAAGRRKTTLHRGRLLRVIAGVARRAFVRAFFTPPERARSDWESYLTSAHEEAESALAVASLPARLEAIADGASTFFNRMMLPLAAPILIPGMVSMRVLSALVSRRASRQTVDALAGSLEGNIVAEMDDALADLVECARALPDAASAIAAGDTDALLAATRGEGGDELRRKWDAFLATYGHRGAGEIDIARPRWSDEPAGLLPSLAGILQGEPGAAQRRLQDARQASVDAEAKILAAVGPVRRALARWLIRRIRGYVAMREHHKFALIAFWGQVRAALVNAGVEAAERGRIERDDDVFMVRIQELYRAAQASGPEADEYWSDLRELIARRKADHARYASMSPPAVMLSNGEVPHVVRPGGELPPGTFEGVPVSAGQVEGVARVLFDPSDAVLAPGEILVAPYTDAAWTTLFIHAGGVVLEAGGSMSHGSVVAREYGIPAVVGLADATTHIADGQRIRVDGESGLVVLLDEQRSEEG